MLKGISRAYTNNYSEASFSCHWHVKFSHVIDMFDCHFSYGIFLIEIFFLTRKSSWIVEFDYFLSIINYNLFKHFRKGQAGYMPIPFSLWYRRTIHFSLCTLNTSEVIIIITIIIKRKVAIHHYLDYCLRMWESAIFSKPSKAMEIKEVGRQYWYGKLLFI